MNPLAQSREIGSLPQMVWNKSVKTLVGVLRSAFNISARMESIPGVSHYL